MLFVIFSSKALKWGAQVTSLCPSGIKSWLWDTTRRVSSTSYSSINPYLLRKQHTNATSLNLVFCCGKLYLICLVIFLFSVSLIIMIRPPLRASLSVMWGLYHLYYIHNIFNIYNNHRDCWLLNVCIISMHTVIYDI